MLTLGVGREGTDMCVDGGCRAGVDGHVLTLGVGREWTDMCVDGECGAGGDGHVC